MSLVPPSGGSLEIGNVCLNEISKHSLNGFPLRGDP